MNKKDLRKLALMGLAGGLIIVNNSSVEAAGIPLSENESTITLAAKCGAKCGGLTASSDIPKSKATDSSPQDKSDANAGNLGWHLMTDKEMLMELNSDGAALYNSLSPEGKALARQVASARCNGTNECSGLNGCKTEHNDCAGKGTCKGTGKCAIADKNLAVELAAKKMAAKRAGAN